jgi:hypothetical protein
MNFPFKTIKIKNVKTIFFKITTGTFSVGIADFIAQHLENKHNKEKEKEKNIINNERLIKQISWGVFSTPLAIFNIYMLNKYFKVIGFKSLLINLLLLQFIIGPCFLITFFIYMNFYNRKSLRDAILDVKKRFYNIWIDQGKYWPFVNFINFYFVPYTYRVYVNQCASMTWNVYISYYMHYKSLARI